MKNIILITIICALFFSFTPKEHLDKKHTSETNSGCGEGVVTLTGLSALENATYKIQFRHFEDKSGKNRIGDFSSNSTRKDSGPNYKQEGEPTIKWIDNETVYILVHGSITNEANPDVANQSIRIKVSLGATYNLCTGGGKGIIHEIMEVGDPD